jgi:outer membrane receptor for ferrienterochelin and colicins
MWSLVLAALIAQGPAAGDAGSVVVPTTEAERWLADAGHDAAGTASDALVADAGLTPAAPQAAAADEPDRSRETVVTGSRTERKAADAIVATEVYTRAQIEQLGVRDLPQLLQQSPGVEMVYTNRGVGLRLQGLDPEYVLILIDGQRVSGRSGPFTDISRFSLREVERIEIVKGPGAALYGAEAIGGVVNLITRRPQQKLEGNVRGMFGTLMETDVRGNVGSKLGAFELRGGGGYRSRRPYTWIPRSDTANADVTSGPGLRRFDYDAEVAYAPSDALRLFARAGYAWTDFNAVDANTTGAKFDRFQRTEQLDVWTGGRGTLPSGTTVTVRGHYGLFKDQFLVDQRNGTALDEYSVNLTKLWEGYAQVDQRLGAHVLSAGVEGLGEFLDSSRIQPSFVSRGRVGVFLQDEWTLLDRGPRLAIAPGVRVDVDSQFGAAPSPRLAIKLDPTQSLTLRSSWGLGFRPPSFSELYLQFSNAGVGYVVRGNPRLKAEYSNSVNVGVDWRPPLEGWLLSASAWHTSLANLINVTAGGTPNPDDPVFFGYENVTNAYTQGVELSARAKLSRGAYLDVGYMGLDARDLTRNRPLEGRSNHRVNVQLSGKYRPTGLEAVVRMTWHGPRPFYSGTGLGFANVLGFEEATLIAPGYVDLEAQVTWSFRSWLKVFVNGYNLLNSGDQNFNPRPPRGVIGGVALEY